MTPSGPTRPHWYGSIPALPGRTCHRVVDHEPDHPAPVRLLGEVCPGDHGAAEPPGSPPGGDRIADETADQRSDSVRLCPRFLVRDNDGIFGQFGGRRSGRSGRSYRSALGLWLGEVLGIKGIPIPYGAPNASPIERFMGSFRRECLDHFIFLSEDHLRRTVTAFITYYNERRPHQGIEGNPECGPGSPRTPASTSGESPIKVAVHPVLGGLHHDYRLPGSSGGTRKFGDCCPGGSGRHSSSPSAGSEPRKRTPCLS